MFALSRISREDLEDSVTILPLFRSFCSASMGIPKRLKSVKASLGLLSLACALLSSGCADHNDFSDDSSEHQAHRGGAGGGGEGRFGHGQGGMYDQSNPSSSMFNPANPSGSPSHLPGEQF